MADASTAMAEGLCAAVTGPQTPNSVSTQRPPKESLWAIFGALAATEVLAGGVLLSLKFGPWPDAVATVRVQALSWLGLGALFCVGVLTIALASSRLGSVKGSAGPVNVDLEGK